MGVGYLIIGVALTALWAYAIVRSFTMQFTMSRMTYYLCIATGALFWVITCAEIKPRRFTQWASSHRFARSVVVFGMLTVCTIFYVVLTSISFGWPFKI